MMDGTRSVVATALLMDALLADRRVATVAATSTR